MGKIFLVGRFKSIRLSLSGGIFAPNYWFVGGSTELAVLNIEGVLYAFWKLRLLCVGGEFCWSVKVFGLALEIICGLLDWDDLWCSGGRYFVNGIFEFV